MGDINLTYWFWFGFAAFLVIFDVILGASFFLLWQGLCTAIIGVILWIAPSISWQHQLLIFAIGSVVSIFLWRRYLKTHTAKSDNPSLNRRGEQYVGRMFTLLEPIVNGRGKVQVEDSTWRVEGIDMPVGTKVLVIGAEGIILKVVKAKDTSP